MQAEGDMEHNGHALPPTVPLDPFEQEIAKLDDWVESMRLANEAKQKYAAKTAELEKKYAADLEAIRRRCEQRIEQEFAEVKRNHLELLLLLGRSNSRKA